MEKKKKYEKPKLEVIVIDEKDIITDSLMNAGLLEDFGDDENKEIFGA